MEEKRYIDTALLSTAAANIVLTCPRSAAEPKQFPFPWILDSLLAVAQVRQTWESHVPSPHKFSPGKG